MIKSLLRNLYSRAVLIAVVVGPILTVINQYDAVTGHARIDWMKVSLTFVVPFVVSVSSSWLTKRLG